MSTWRSSTACAMRPVAVDHVCPQGAETGPPSRSQPSFARNAKRATQARSDLIAHFGGDADPAATMQAVAGEILRVRHAMSQIVKLITLATEGRDAVLVRARPMSPPIASASGS
jgi:hypothetical protein